MQALHTSLSNWHHPDKYLFYDYFCLMTFYCRHSALTSKCQYYCPACSLVMCTSCVLTHVICKLSDTEIPYCVACKQPLPTKVLARLSLISFQWYSSEYTTVIFIDSNDFALYMTWSNETSRKSLFFVLMIDNSPLQIILDILIVIVSNLGNWFLQQVKDFNA